jgi:vesicle coat complex subunit
LNEQRTAQLQYLTAVVKIFLKFSEAAEELITQLLQTATEQALNPDIRDRAYIYWRLLSTDPEKTKKLVFTEKPAMKEEVHKYETEFLENMVVNLAKISTSFHKLPKEVFKNHMDDYIT